MVLGPPPAHAEAFASFITLQLPQGEDHASPHHAPMCDTLYINNALPTVISQLSAYKKGLALQVH